MRFLPDLWTDNDNDYRELEQTESTAAPEPEPEPTQCSDCNGTGCSGSPGGGWDSQCLRCGGTGHVH